MLDSISLAVLRSRHIGGIERLRGLHDTSGLDLVGSATAPFLLPVLAIGHRPHSLHFFGVFWIPMASEASWLTVLVHDVRLCCGRAR